MTGTAITLSPVLLQQWQQLKQERAKEREVDSERQRSRDHQMMSELRQRDEEAKRDANYRAIEAKQQELEREIKQVQDETAILRMEAVNRRPLALFDIFFSL